ncbi:Integrin alpha-M [Camelus dromedarius]|uniref:Integrin alpha-M n=1 Tax=Camelus dromedarius TaxID=9838 RepID=A0A5N4CX98_CAMDR|nr:Integrin alpha-M [Camelus dromedarius]
MAHRVLLLTALALSHGFNLDTKNPVIFQNNAKGFGQSVVQLEGSRLVVGAPQEIKSANQTGGLYQCDYSMGTCEPILLQVPQQAVNMSLGLSLAFATKPFRLLACGPTVHQTCKENTYVNGMCFLFGSNLLQQPRRFPETFRGCPQQDSDIAFLIDGSGSINPRDFQRMKEFVSTVMSQFQKSKTLFSLMQYSEDFQIHFTFNDFKRNPYPELLVRPIIQLLGRTHTATGILKVVRELFHSSRGARENALKILVVITDGEKFGDPLEYKDVIPEADRRRVIRYVIGVGDAFNSKKSRKELNTIASQPSRDHVFQVDNFEALKTIQNQLQEKIFAIEGTQSGSASSFEYEMSQEGFSAAITSDKVTFINTTRVDSDMNDAYLGYAADVIFRNRVQSLVLGAPRYQHTGLVVMFRQDTGAWEKIADVKGSQIGSYFGASLCSVDVNRDGSSDLVLIGAPHYYEQTRGGQVSVCPLPKGRAKWQCGAVLRGEQGHPWSRFGAALTVMGDVNGDKLMDVAIGAPGEQENQGAVYLFHGTSGLSISPSHSQRIAGSQLSLRLQHFGQSLSGGRDLTMDGLVDLAVGAQGHVLLLRSQPVLRVEVTMEFTPREVARSVYECTEKVVKSRSAGEVKICLQVRKSTWDRLGEGRPQSQAIFDETKNSTRRRVQTLGLSRKCETLQLRLMDCVDDSVTPIALRLNFSLVGNPSPSFGNLRPVLAVDAQRLFTASFPFEKNCGNDTICQDDLSITFSFMNLDTLVVGGPRDLNVMLTVRNQGEDSYRTQVTFFYPSGLSFRRVSGAQNQRSQRSWRLSCESDVFTEGSGTLKSTPCSINHPIFPDNSESSLLPFSENNMPRTNKTEFQLELPVKYAIYVLVNRCWLLGLLLCLHHRADVVRCVCVCAGLYTCAWVTPLMFCHLLPLLLSPTSLEVSTKYLNFTASEKTRHIIEHQYQFNNLGPKKLPISVVFWVPIRLNQMTVWDRPQVTFSQNLSSRCYTKEVSPPRSDFQAELNKNPVLNCSIAVCQRIQCDIPSFGVQEEFSVTLKGNLSFDWYIKTSHNHLQVVSTAEIVFDDSEFALLAGQSAFVRAQTETKVEPYEVHNPVPLIVGSSVGGLVLLALITAALYKLGFFKRQYKDMMSEGGPQAAEPQ